MRNGFIREHLINSLAVDGVYFGIVAGTLSIKILSLDCSSSSLTNCASNGPQILAKLRLKLDLRLPAKKRALIVKVG